MISMTTGDEKITLDLAVVIDFEKAQRLNPIPERSFKRSCYEGSSTFRFQQQ